MQNHFKNYGNKANFEHCNCNSERGSNCLNLTMCTTTTGVNTFSMGAWNPLATSTEAHQTVRIPVSGADWSVVDGEGNKVAAQVQVIDQRTLSLPCYTSIITKYQEELPKLIDAYSNKATHVLTFSIGNIPPMGYKVFLQLLDHPLMGRISSAAAVPKLKRHTFDVYPKLMGLLQCQMVYMN